MACNATTNRQRLVGTGAVTCRASRDGALDKLYDPTRLRPVLRVATAAAAGCLQPIPQDPLPLKVENGRLVKVPPRVGRCPCGEGESEPPTLPLSGRGPRTHFGATTA